MERVLKNEMEEINILNTFYLSNLLKYTQKIGDSDTLELMMCFMTDSSKEGFIKEISEFAKKRNLDLNYTFESIDDGSRAINEIFDDFMSNKIINHHYQNRVIEAFMKNERSSKALKRTLFNKRIEESAKFFNLDQIDIEILTLIYLTETNDITDKIVEQLNGYDRRIRKNRFNNDLDPRSIATLLSQNYSIITKHLQNSALLKSSGILDMDNELNEDIRYYIDGMSDKPLMQKYYSEFEGNILSLNELSMNEKDIRLIKILFENRQPQKGVNILLYGDPGTGKTEFARSFAKTFSGSVYEIYNETNEDNYKRRRSDNRTIALKACQQKIERDDSIIIIDEADTLLGASNGGFSFFFSGDSEKGEINNLLDQTSTFNIWITNSIYGINESTLRRFDYSIEFEPFSLLQREKIWRNLIEKKNIENYFSDETVNMLADKYKINAAGISMALNHTIQGVGKQIAAKEFLSILESFLSTHNRLIKGKKSFNDNKKSFAPHYSLEGLNINGNVKNAIDTAALFNKALLNSDDGNDFPLQNINFLLYGPPGTGKTEFAKYLARELKRPLIIKTASDLLSMWVGGSEQNIANAFSEAQRDKAILLIDEVDSMLFSRQDASKSWELSQVNELLTQMENFKGIFIASTNMKSLMDSAAIRRFNFKLMFDYLNSAGNEKFYEIFLQMLVKTPLDEWQKRRLRGLKLLTPGDFKNVYQQNILLAQDLPHDKLIDDLTVEVLLKNENRSKIGFVN
jgi:SpoVK/Ycf46/Vps4 family AAA+-type ATPase